MCIKFAFGRVEEISVGNALFTKKCFHKALRENYFLILRRPRSTAFLFGAYIAMWRILNKIAKSVHLFLHKCVNYKEYVVTRHVNKENTEFFCQILSGISSISEELKRKNNNMYMYFSCK